MILTNSASHREDAAHRDARPIGSCPRDVRGQAGYLGSNVSDNVKKMVENGYLAQERSVHDRRSVHVKLTGKGRKLRDRLSGMHERHIKLLKQTAVTETDLEAVATTLRRLERFWMHTGDLAGTRGEFAA